MQRQKERDIRQDILLNCKLTEPPTHQKKEKTQNFKLKSVTMSPWDD